MTFWAPVACCIQGVPKVTAQSAKLLAERAVTISQQAVAMLAAHAEVARQAPTACCDEGGPRVTAQSLKLLAERAKAAGTALPVSCAALTRKLLAELAEAVGRALPGAASLLQRERPRGRLGGRAVELPADLKEAARRVLPAS